MSLNRFKRLSQVWSQRQRLASFPPPSKLLIGYTPPVLVHLV